MSWLPEASVLIETMTRVIITGSEGKAAAQARALIPMPVLCSLSRVELGGNRRESLVESFRVTSGFALPSAAAASLVQKDSADTPVYIELAVDYLRAVSLGMLPITHVGPADDMAKILSEEATRLPATLSKLLDFTLDHIEHCIGADTAAALLPGLLITGGGLLFSELIPLINSICGETRHVSSLVRVFSRISGLMSAIPGLAECPFSIKHTCLAGAIARRYLSPCPEACGAAKVGRVCGHGVSSDMAWRVKDGKLLLTAAKLQYIFFSFSFSFC